MADWILKKNGEVINVIVADEDFAKAYAEKNGYEIEERIIETPDIIEQPTDKERIKALEAAVQLLSMPDQN